MNYFLASHLIATTHWAFSTPWHGRKKPGRWTRKPVFWMQWLPPIQNSSTFSANWTEWISSTPFKSVTVWISCVCMQHAMYWLITCTLRVLPFSRDRSYSLLKFTHQPYPDLSYCRHVHDWKHFTAPRSGWWRTTHYQTLCRPQGIETHLSTW